jgi:Tol biopolymer transport system component
MLLALGATAEAGFPGKDGRLAAVLQQPGALYCPDENAGPHDCGWRDTIETFRRDGSGRDQVAQRATKSADERLNHVAWSPDGRRIAYLSGPQPALMRADGSHRHLLRKGHFFGFYYSVAWAPDGRHLFLGGSSLENGNDGIYRVRTDGTHLRRLTHGGDNDPAVSTKGVIAFERVIHGTSWIFVLRRPGARPKALLRGSDPDWSPNGKRLAFARNGIWLCAASGRHCSHVTHGQPDTSDFRDRDPAWSPSGRWLAFVRNPDLYLVRPNGTGLRRVPLTIQDQKMWDSLSWQPLQAHR